MAPEACAACRVIRRMALAYGRNASIRCTARRSRAAATMAMARVIFSIFVTALMRVRTSRGDSGMVVETRVHYCTNAACSFSSVD